MGHKFPINVLSCPILIHFISLANSFHINILLSFVLCCPNFIHFISLLFSPKPNLEFPFIAAGKLLQTMHCFVMLPAFLQRIPSRLLFSSGTDKRVCIRSIPFACFQRVWSLIHKKLCFVIQGRNAKLKFIA